MAFVGPLSWGIGKEVVCYCMNLGGTPRVSVRSGHVACRKALPGVLEKESDVLEGLDGPDVMLSRKYDKRAGLCLRNSETDADYAAEGSHALVQLGCAICCYCKAALTSLL